MLRSAAAASQASRSTQAGAPYDANAAADLVRLRDGDRAEQGLAWTRAATWPVLPGQSLRGACQRDGRVGPGPPVDEPVAADQPDPLAAFRLTERERKILDLVTTGRSSRQIVEQLFISPKTVSVHVSNLLAKLGVAGRLEAAARAHRLSGRPNRLVARWTRWRDRRLRSAILRPARRSDWRPTLPTTVKAYTAPSATERLVPTTIERRDLGPHDVMIEITYAGVCHSDIHAARGEWGELTWPIVVGHEIAGVVSEVGSAVTRHAVGDRVGVGCLVDSCRECENCVRGLEQYCLNGAVGTYGSVGRDGKPTAGGYSTHIVVTEDFVLRIPEGLGLDVAAPLLCAGITLYSPLSHWGAGPGKEVAIVGLGGLGHMGVKIAHAKGAGVTVLSQSLKKQEDGLHLGADAYHATSDPDTFSALKGRFDLIVNTVSAPLPMDDYLSMLRTDGTMVQVGAPPEPISVGVGSLMSGRRSLAGSGIGGIPETQEMLDFCAEHHLGAEIEVIRAEQVNEAWDRVVASDVRYRFVIDNSTI